MRTAGMASSRRCRPPDGDQTRLFQLAIDNMAQGLFMLDADQRIIVLNRQFLDIYNLPADVIKVGATARDIVEQSIQAGNYPGYSLEEAWARASNRLATKLPWRIQQRLGNGKVVAIAYEPMPGGGWVTTHLDVTDRQNAEDQLAYLAGHDALTGLANRLILLETLTRHLEDGLPLGVLCLDLDRFKAVNDTLGHAAGDDLLRQVADRLRGCLRETDTVARLGGDEFAILQRPAGRRDADARLARRIVETLAEPFDLGSHRVQIGVSIGIALAPRNGRVGEDLLKHADTALYRAKADGRGTFRFFETEMDQRLERRRMLEFDLRGAIDRNELEVHYQPLVELAGHRVIGFEALLRWRHPQRGLISPGDFIPLAEETGLIVPIGEWVLRAACAEATRWPAHVCVAVNLSPVQFQRSDLVATVRSALDAAGLAPARLELEITESVLLQDHVDSVTALHDLRAMGIAIALDDFGTGYSSLSYLRSFPFDKIKIDKSFVRDLSAKDDCRAIVGAVAALGWSLGMHVSAEGVETISQVNHLRDAGCRSVQGYLFGRPVPAREAAQVLRRDLLGAPRRA